MTNKYNEANVSVKTEITWPLNKDWKRIMRMLIKKTKISMDQSINIHDQSIGCVKKLVKAWGAYEDGLNLYVF